jgi:predicted regulator of Ras-like GTPase activity (Roadblock/LC7/MglB family)
MVAMVEPAVATSLMEEIQKIERGTDLKRVAVISRAGMKIATALSDQMDADAETASSAAIIDLADRLSESTQHGALREIVVKADKGFVILQFINQEFMVFGGISDPLKVGFYLEYLRSESKRFAFILAGNQVTEDLKKEIEAQNAREEKIKEDAKKSLAADFQMDKSAQNDMSAMQDVLSFLNDWGGDEANVKPDQNNIVSIDSDLLMGFNGADDLAPTPITQGQLSDAQKVAPAQEEEAILDDIANVVSALQPKTTGTAQTPIGENPASGSTDDGGLPDDILAALNEIAETTKPTIKAAKKAEAEQTSLPYGILLYEGEVPPVPLNDYISFEVGTLTGQQADTAVSPETVNQPQPSYQEEAQPRATPYQQDIAPVGQENPNFDSMASEYDDADLDLEEDAMLQALNELGLSDDKKKKQ